MRMASGRGQSHFNVNDFLQPFMINQGLVHYPMNVNTSNDYYRDEKEARDKTSFLPICGYSKGKASKSNVNCNLFDPVITDLGICYSFNAKPITPMLADSSFKEAFVEAYNSDLHNRPLVNARGAGDTFALTFMVDNSRYLRKKLDIRPFKVLISSKMAYFDAFSVAKNVKPGFETIFDVQPIEVVGTDNLQDVPEKSRYKNHDQKILIIG